MTPPETEARLALQKALEETYASDKFEIKPHRLHKSLGDTGTVIGVHIDRTQHGRAYLNAEMHAVVQFYGDYSKVINREESADPSEIEKYAERFREKIRDKIDPVTPGVWYFLVDRTDFPVDPLEGQTRYEMHLTAHGNNTTFLETS